MLIWYVATYRSVRLGTVSPLTTHLADSQRWMVAIGCVIVPVMVFTMHDSVALTMKKNFVEWHDTSLMPFWDDR